jgi:hypothetical protein
LAEAKYSSAQNVKFKNHERIVEEGALSILRGLKELGGFREIGS